MDSVNRGMTGWLWGAFAAVRERAESDADLLGRFVRTRDEQAFRELVRRLGPTVYGACRRHLGNTADADDAFQTTFTVLARKANTIRPAGKVAAWVYGVASLAARKLRLTRLRRQLREMAVSHLPDRPAPEGEMDADLLPAVDEELGRLPENFRLPIVLCGVRGLTVAQAAGELGWPVGTVASRLSRGRAELGKRLAKRGITLAAVVSTAGGWAELAAGVPPRLIEQTVAAATGGTLPPAVAALTSEVVTAMTWTPLRRLGASLVCVSALALAGGGVLISNGLAAPVPTAPAVGDAKPTLDRVKLENVAGLLRQESVRKEVGLSDDDYKALTEFRDGKQTEVQKAIQNDIQAQIQAQANRGGGNIAISINTEMHTKATAEAEAEYLKKVGESLKPAGMKRLKQAVLQAAGPRALLDRLAIRELQLTAEQEDKIDALLSPTPTEIVANGQVAKQAEARDTELAAVVKVLTADQKKKWDALVGKALPTADLIKASPLSEETMNEQMKWQGGFGGFGPAIPVPGGVIPAVPVVPPPAQEKKEEKKEE